MSMRRLKKICGGCVGKERFCISEAKAGEHLKGTCGKVTHVKKAPLPQEECYYVPAQQSLDSRTAFLRPFLRRATITQEYLERIGVETHTSLEWEEFFIDALNAYRAELDAQEDDEDEASAESVTERATKGESAAADPKILEELPEYNRAKSAFNPSPPEFVEELTAEGPFYEPIEELRRSMASTFQQLIIVAGESFQEGEAAVNHMTAALTPVLSRVNEISRELHKLAAGIGEVDDVAQTGFDSISGWMAHSVSAAQKDQSEMVNLRDKVDRLQELAEKLESDLFVTKERTVDSLADSAQRSTQRVMEVLERLVRVEEEVLARPQGAAAPSGHHGLADLPTTASVVAEDGTVLFSLGAFIQEMRGLKAQVDKLEEAHAAMGGENTVFDMPIPSESEIIDWITAEKPDGSKVAECFIDAVSAHTHDNKFDPTSDWKKDTKALGEAGFTSVERKYSIALKECHNAWYTSGKKVEAGKVVDAFTSAAKWKGEGGQKGVREQIDSSMQTSLLAHATYVNDSLPIGGKLYSLALRCGTATQAWFRRMHSHFDCELLKLNQLGLSEEECIELLSDEVVITFDKLYTRRLQAIELTTTTDKVKYAARAVRIALMTHAEMDCFTRDDPKFNPAIGAAFIRFLTKHIGGNAVLVQLQSIKDIATTARTTANTASKTAEGAKTKSEKAQSDVDSLRNTVNNLKKGGKGVP